MEDYAGLAILATNRRSVARHRVPPPAAVRRSSSRSRARTTGAAIWERVFPRRRPRSTASTTALLARLELTGGNIRSIAINAAFLAAAERGPIRMSHVVRAAAREYAKLSQADQRGRVR